MIDKQAAVKIRQQALSAISELSRLLFATENQGPQDEYDDLRAEVGSCLAAIDTYLLNTVYKEYPQMDDLK